MYVCDCVRGRIELITCLFDCLQVLFDFVFSHHFPLTAQTHSITYSLTHSLTHSFFVVSSQCVCARVYVCLWLCERACVLCSVVEITPAAMAGYFVKCAAMPELFLRELVFLCLLVCVLVLVSSCVIVLCACAFTCSCVLVCVCEYMCVCSQFNKCNVNVINENTWKLMRICF